MSSYYLHDALSLTLGLIHALLRIALDSVDPFCPRLCLTDLEDPRLLSTYINQDVVNVENDATSIGEGAGGTGTSRRALVATLKVSDCSFLSFSLSLTSYFSLTPIH
jgi:hypothetical protein